MRRTVLAATAATAGIALIVTGCSSSTDSSNTAAPAASTPVASAPAPAKQQLDAAAALAALTAHAPTIKQVKAYTADTDPNHLLGRPGQYTSKVAFNDSRIKAEDVEGQDEDAVIRGGSIEVFASAADATARAAYLEKVTKSMPALVEYDFVVRETAVLRVSQRLSPDQAKALADALKG
ncbi:hypothetical protein ACFYST_30500 [Kitasatospora sp. NPDC004614]|uniref:hypothetical protein n=1 Tax=unclassified Kitasatospora TaxID=2633591 RepID=UPI0036C628FE